MLDHIHVDEIIMNALKEDMSLGDITSDSLIRSAQISRGRFIAKESGIIAGMDVAERVFMLLDCSMKFTRLVDDGTAVKKGDVIAEIEGDTRSILKGERTALNFMQRMSGIASRTNEYVKQIKDLPVRIVDTRKTVPGLRLLDKYSVVAGGGHNHRYSLSDGVLIKDNHINACGGIKKAIERTRSMVPHTMKIEVETETMDQVNEAIEAGADIIMLDNMSLVTMAEAVKLINGRATVEASGNVSMDRIYDIARTGVDVISIGELTHSVKAFDISLKFV